MGEIFERSVPAKPLTWTGERLTTEAGQQVEIEHLHRYLFARDLCRGLDVLDVAAGEGYGSSLLAQTAHSVVGVELDPASVAHAAEAYANAKLRFELGDARRLPLPDACVDVVVSFETIEHFYEHDVFLAEIRRVLRPGGRLVVSSPERDVYSPAGQPPNPYHVRELTRAEFASLLAQSFRHIAMFGQRPMLGSALIAENGEARQTPTLTFERRSDRMFEASTGLPRPVYLLAVASDDPLHGVSDSLYIDSHLVEPASPALASGDDFAQVKAALDDAGVYARHVEAELASCRSRLAGLEAGLVARDEYADRVTLENELARVEIGRLLAELAEKADLARSFRSGLSARDRALNEAKRMVERARAERGFVGAHAAALSSELEERLAHIRTLDGIVQHHQSEAAQHHQAYLARTHELQAEAAQHHQAYLARTHELQAVLASSSWRITWPIRSLMGQNAHMRRSTRRAAKLLWWTATLQLRRRIAARPQGLRDEPAHEPAPAPLLLAPLATAPLAATPLPGIVPTAPLDLKSLFTIHAKAELAAFLASGDRLTFPPAQPSDVSVVVVLWNQAHFTLRCLRALHGQVGVGLEIVLVDNASSDETQELLSRLDGVRILRRETNDGFLLGCNLGAAAAMGRALLLLNSDAFVHAGAIAAALAALDADRTVGAVGGRLVLPSGLLQEAGSMIWSDGGTLGYDRGLAPDAGEAMYRRDVDYCSGAFLLTPRSVWESLGGFDNAYCPAYYEEADYCMRLREEGLRVVYEPAALIDHFEFGSEGKEGEALATLLRNRQHFRARHALALGTKHLPPSVANVLFARDRVPAGTRRLLVIDNEVPLAALGSGYPRVRELLREASGLGWAVTFYPLHQLTFDWDVVRAEIPWEIEITAGLAIPRLAEFLAERRGYYDAMIVSRPNNMESVHAILRAHPDLIGHTRLIYDAEALFSARDVLKARLDGTPLTELEIDKRVAAETAMADSAVGIICVNEAEAEVFRVRQPAPVHVLSHPVEPPTATPDYEARTGFLFVGRLLEHDSPNWSGLLWFIRECWPLIRASLPDAVLSVVGKLHPEHTDLQGAGIELVGPVAELAPVYAKARVFVAPIRFAAGVPIKIIEATAAGLPTIGTGLMARQLGWSQAEIVTHETAAELATASVGLYLDPIAWQATRSAAMLRLQFEHSRKGFRDALKRVLEGASPTSAMDDKAKEHRIARVEAVWGSAPPTEAALQWSTYPMSHPVVQAAMNRRATGNASQDPYGRLRELMADWGFQLPLSRVASLCCGAGALERSLGQLGLLSHCVGLDLAGGALDAARVAAAAEGIPGLTYERRDLEREGLGLNGLDLVLAHQGVHHLSNLEAVFDSVYTALAPGGVFHLHEFMGPDRFQWSDRQVAEITAWLQSLPEPYRTTRAGAVKSQGGRATIEEMLAYDPSEAVRSSAIEPTVAARFEIVERRALGGTLAMMALADIAQNFDPASPEAVAHIERLLAREDELIASGELVSDFVVVVARRPK